MIFEFTIFENFEKYRIECRIEPEVRSLVQNVEKHEIFEQFRSEAEIVEFS